MKLSVFSIVKNEEKCIQKMLSSVKGAYEHVILDTGSTDKTIEIIKKWSQEVNPIVLYTDYKWNDDFAEAKNLAMERCTGDWIIGIDADCYFEKDGIKKIKEIIETTEEDCINITLQAEGNPNQTHKMPKLFRASKKIRYFGRAHESVKTPGKDVGDVKIIYGYSENHFKDPDRYIRILSKSVQENPDTPRWKFYLAREFYYKKEYQKALDLFEQYIKIAKWTPEIVEAYIIMSKCLFCLHRGDEARVICMKAIGLNPDHRGALNWMASLCYEPWKSKWKRIADRAENKDVMFKV